MKWEWIKLNNNNRIKKYINEFSDRSKDSTRALRIISWQSQSIMAAESETEHQSEQEEHNNSGQDSDIEFLGQCPASRHQKVNSN